MSTQISSGIEAGDKVSPDALSSAVYILFKNEKRISQNRNARTMLANTYSPCHTSLCCYTAQFDVHLSKVSLKSSTVKVVSDAQEK